RGCTDLSEVTPVHRIIIGKRSARPAWRFWGPCSPNPWTNSLFVGPPNRRPIDASSHSAERRQQRAAIRAWEDEGGSVAASPERRSTYLHIRCTRYSSSFSVISNMCPCVR